MTSTQAVVELSLVDFLKLPETKPVSEYIDGQAYPKPMPKGKHSAIQTMLAPAINQIGIPKRSARAFTELRCTFGGRSLVLDVSVFRWQRIPLDDSGEIENTFEIAPDWAIEVLSPEQSPVRVIDNLLFCLNHGAVLGWLIAPEDYSVMVFQPGRQPEVLQGDGVLPVLDGLGDWVLTSRSVFEWLNLG
jgi:Uma2 family endonuclease